MNLVNLGLFVKCKINSSAAGLKVEGYIKERIFILDSTFIEAYLPTVGVANICFNNSPTRTIWRELC